MISPRLLFHLSLVLSTILPASAWSPSTHHMGRILVGQSQSCVPFLAKQSDDTDLVKDEIEEDSTSASFGVSFIGGDPCGSKYNDDPFDATKEAAFKPGFPDDMKARIEQLAAKKLEEQKSD
mmetsp:Transcript_7294/g.12213  ORF Transcript_7294/g.12213 Transcript_7294/m.12213 type:complete len:122 (+) Transcript_7294:263-628(+)